MFITLLMHSSESTLQKNVLKSKSQNNATYSFLSTKKLIEIKSDLKIKCS